MKLLQYSSILILLPTYTLFCDNDNKLKFELFKCLFPLLFCTSIYVHQFEYENIKEMSWISFPFIIITLDRFIAHFIILYHLYLAILYIELYSSYIIMITTLYSIMVFYTGLTKINKLYHMGIHIFTCTSSYLFFNDLKNIL